MSNATTGSGGGGGGGISSINSDTTAAQVITGSNNISASTSGGTTTVNGSLLAPKASPTFTGTIGTALTASKAVVTDSSGNLSTGTISIAQGGTGQTSAQAAIDALLPSQASASGKFLTSNGTSSSWGTASGFTAYSACYGGATTTMVQNTKTIIQNNTKIWDDTNGSGSDLVTTGSSWVFTVPSDGAGKYLVSVAFNFVSATWVATEWAEVLLSSGSNVDLAPIISIEAAVAATYYLAQVSSCVIKCAAGDTLRIRGYTNHSNLALLNDTVYNRVTIIRLTGS